MATILTVTANTLLDHLARSALPAGAVTRIERFEIVAGGKGLNVGRVLARHGHRVLATGFAGGSSGQTLTDLVVADGVQAHFIPTAARTRIGFLCQHPSGGKTSLLEDGFPVTEGEVEDLAARIRELLPQVDLVIVSGSVPDPNCTFLYRLVLDACFLANVPCWIDSYGVAMDQALAAPHPPGLAKPNLEEYGPSGLRWVTAGELHLTDGAHEIRVRHPQGRFRVTPPQVLEKNPVGSGDCYLAALAHARLSGWDLIAQLRYAAAAGAANAAHGEVARIRPADIEALIGKVSIRTSSD